MSVLNKIISSLGILCLFGCSNQNAEQERLDLLAWINHQLTQINQTLGTDIENEKKGFYPHPGKQEYQSKGEIEYLLLDKQGKRLELSRHDLLTLQDIKSTDGYQLLETTAQSLAVILSIKEHEVDGDGVESTLELDEYSDDVQRYYSIRVYGW